MKRIIVYEDTLNPFVQMQFSNIFYCLKTAVEVTEQRLSHRDTCSFLFRSALMTSLQDVVTVFNDIR